MVDAFLVKHSQTKRLRYLRTWVAKQMHMSHGEQQHTISLDPEQWHEPEPDHFAQPVEAVLGTQAMLLELHVQFMPRSTKTADVYAIDRASGQRLDTCWV